MYQKGDIVIYGAHGICRVEEVAPLKMRIATEHRLYYTLRAYYQQELVIYAPVDGAAIVIRPPLTKVEAEAVIADLPGIEPLTVQDEKKREADYRAVLHGCDCRAIAALLKTLRARRVQRAKQGRHPTGLDERYTHLAEEQLYGELGYVLGIPRAEAPAYVRRQLGLDEADAS